MRTSCIIPTRNRCHMIEAAIESVLQQSLKQIEIIVVDDNSSDKTVTFLKQSYPQVHIVSLPAQVGPGIARNMGVAVAQGEIIMFLDSDDCWLPQHAASLLDVMEKGFEVVYGTTLTKDLLGGEEFFIPDTGQGLNGDCLPILARWCFLVPSSVALTRQAFERVGGFTGDKLGEDWIFFVKLAEHYSFGFCGPDPITIRNLHKGSICNLTDNDAIVYAVRSVGKTLRASRKFDKSQVQRFLHFENWVMENSIAWKTVQDCYCAMKKEGMI